MGRTGCFSLSESHCERRGCTVSSLKFLLSVNAHMFPLCCPPSSIQSMCVCAWSDSAVLYYICHPSFHLSQVLPWLLQTHCCLFFEKDPGKKWDGCVSQTK